MSLPTDGLAVTPVMFFGNIFWTQLTNAISGYCNGNGAPDLSLSDGKMNPLDLFEKYPPSYGVGQAIAFVIVNNLKVPLTGVACLPPGVLDDQLFSYPAVIDPDTKTVYKPHQIPGKRRYPKPSQHAKGDETSPLSWLGCVGLYRLPYFQALAFSLKEDGSGPLMGVASQVSNSKSTVPAVSLDLSEFGKPTTEENLVALSQSQPVSGIETNGSIEFGASWATEVPQFEPMIRTMLVWVQDDPEPYDPDDPDDPRNFRPFGN